MEYSWISVPASNALETKSGWAQLPKNQFAALRHLLLVVEQNPITKSGPLHNEVDWPSSTEYTHVEKKKRVVKYTAGINESITSAITQQYSTEMISKVNSGLKTGGLLEATISGELQEKTGTVITDALTRGLSVTTSFHWEEEFENTQTIKIAVPKNASSEKGKRVKIYYRVKEYRWDIFLYQSDYLELEYHKNWVWPDVRKTIKSDTVQLKKPLFSIIFYEPIPIPSFEFEDFNPEVASMTEILTEALTKVCPNRTTPELPNLEYLAKIAFPVTRIDKEEVRKRVLKKAASRNPGSGFGIKRASAKKSMKKAAPKRAAKKAAPKKRAIAKKAAPKRK
ncbi:MAG: hypothetical protein IPN13_00400 [Bacteroidetes bacterium]|nr:hypothetical protein [Bacteroidota bacterium]